MPFSLANVQESVFESALGKTQPANSNFLLSANPETGSEKIAGL
jgi:hypothetical protein